ncbi:response regulator transcription factor [Terriglobus sp. TAA 43]|uniref:response regulator transcription factor n=1 Tax=Terriglobus sp. TAA 43 TaxID=278961 RepID=UPI000646DC20|nr:response regulator transcription factor [Terriglobus sp. TAA 43]
MHILVIEDDTRIAALVNRALREAGYQVTLCYDGVEGEQKLLTGQFDLALLDIMLPGLDGLSVLERVRRKLCKTPILVLTAVDAVPKIVQVFDLGADDYLVKPFILEILLARVAALGRRATREEPTVLAAGGISLDPARRVAVSSGREVALTRKQYRLLELLMKRKGVITSREQLIEAGWIPGADVKENTLDVYIHGLRSKLQPVGSQNVIIRTVHGLGYIFEEA